MGCFLPSALRTAVRRFARELGEVHRGDPRLLHEVQVRAEGGYLLTHAAELDLARLLQPPDGCQHDRIALEEALVGTGADEQRAERVSDAEKLVSPARSVALAIAMYLPAGTSTRATVGNRSSFVGTPNNPFRTPWKATVGSPFEPSLASCLILVRDSLPGFDLKFFGRSLAWTLPSDPKLACGTGAGSPLGSLLAPGQRRLGSRARPSGTGIYDAESAGRVVVAPLDRAVRTRDGRDGDAADRDD